MVSKVFQNGATWLRADFHLHTKTDRSFIYSGDENYYFSTYVDALASADIRIGVITNHNKFNFEEFKALRKTAKGKEIYLLPGVELSINDGFNGVHLLIVFSDEWLTNDNDRISSFLSSMFPGKAIAEYQNENGRSDKNILQTVEELNRTEFDYFIIFAHVEDSKGLWKEFAGGKLQSLHQKIKERTLGFQQVRTSDKREQVKKWLGAWYPAEVEGSDPKSIDQIGQKRPCFLKIGHPSFEAVKFALVAHEGRLCSDSIPKFTHSYIKEIRFRGGTHDGLSIPFSPELNTLIGIRGSGKSTVLEAIRYALNIRIEENDSERVYKKKLVERTLGNGGEVELEVFDRNVLSCQIKRVGMNKPEVFLNGKSHSGVSICETILYKPLFFGQKELATAGKGSENDLIEKLIGGKCDEIRRRIAEQKSKVCDVIEKLSKVRDIGEQIEEQDNIKRNTTYRLEFYKKHNLDEKLRKRLDFEADIRKVKAGLHLVEHFTFDVRDLIAKYEDDLRNFTGYVSAVNADFFAEFDAIFLRIIKSLEAINEALVKADSALSDLKSEHTKLVASKTGLADEFAAIERALTNELKTPDKQNIRTDDFLNLTKQLAAAETALAILSKSREQKALLKLELQEALQNLKDLWHQEYIIIKQELDKVSENNSALKFSIGFKEDKKNFLDFFQNIISGIGTHKSTLQNIINEYADFIDIYWDLENAKKLFGSNPDSVSALFEQNLKSLLTYQPPNKFTIEYHGAELARHSLGQRASALILFVLGKKDNDVIIIDQPEDDLDNQTIYEDVIKLIKEIKPDVQFIFATHNPNIPVLGDAEQIHACTFKDEIIDVQSGGLDDPEQQKRIVSIMEGGKEAFERRKKIYNIWKPLNY